MLEFGTPQGSSGSCVIFALFVGDIGQWLDDCMVLAFADDTFITLEANTMEELHVKMEEQGEKVLEFFTKNLMVTNPSKTELLVFRPTSPRTQQIPESTTLCGADNAKLLGVWISKDLKFSKHIDELKKDLNYSISILWRLRKLLNG